MNTSNKNLIRVALISLIAYCTYYLIGNSALLYDLYFDPTQKLSAVGFAIFLVLIIVRYAAFLTSIVTAGFFVYMYLKRREIL